MYLDMIQATFKALLHMSRNIFRDKINIFEDKENINGVKYQILCNQGGPLDQDWIKGQEQFMDTI